MGSKKPEPIATGWLASRWLEYMRHEICFGPHTNAQVSSARRAPTRINFDRGKMEAQVEVGSFGRREEVLVRFNPIGKRDWRRVIKAMAESPDLARALLAGQFSPELETLFDKLGLELFPQCTDWEPYKCTCHSYGSCRHYNALLVHGAAILDGNPFLWLTVLGMDREPLLTAIRTQLEEMGALDERPAAPPLSPQRYWAGEEDPDAIPVRVGSSLKPDGLLRRLGPVPPPAPEQLSYVLRQLVTVIANEAAALARGERPSIHRPNDLPGKLLPNKERLRPEVIEAVRQEGRVLSLDQLQSLTPTAVAMTTDTARRALAESLTDLPEDVVALGGWYVAPRGTVLEGASFCHVVTFDEWHSARLSEDADWVRALRLTGFPLPDQVLVNGVPSALDSVLGKLHAMVGDEVWLTVIDPERPVIEASLRRRIDRSWRDLQWPSEAAGEQLLEHMRRIRRISLTEEEALGFLLGSRRHRERNCPDEVWLIPSVVPQLSIEGDRKLTLTYNYWAPFFERARMGYWDSEKWIQRYQGRLMKRGERRQTIETATRVVQTWLQYWRHPQTESPVPLGALLYFLWIAAPRLLSHLRVASDQVMLALSEWFAMLEEAMGTPGIYRPHMAALTLTSLYADRIRTLSQPHHVADHLSWNAEGWRWIGPSWYFFTPSPS